MRLGVRFKGSRAFFWLLTLGGLGLLFGCGQGETDDRSTNSVQPTLSFINASADDPENEVTSTSTTTPNPGVCCIWRALCWDNSDYVSWSSTGTCYPWKSAHHIEVMPVADDSYDVSRCSRDCPPKN